MLLLRRPYETEYAPFYATYVDCVPDKIDLPAYLEAQPGAWSWILDVDPDLTYASGKWTVREVVQHVIDTERVFAFRALWWARGDGSALPGFEQDAWVRHAPPQSMEALLAEMRTVRAATLALFDPLDAAAWDRVGLASGHYMSARAAAWVIAGHTSHHAQILKTRYLGLS